MSRMSRPISTVTGAALAATGVCLAIAAMVAVLVVGPSISSAASPAPTATARHLTIAAPTTRPSARHASIAAIRVGPRARHPRTGVPAISAAY